MPASYYWAPPLGSDLSAATASNWRIGSGPSLLASQPPDGDDHLYFVGGLGQMDCLIPAALTASSGNAFAGMHLKFGPGPTTATGDGESGGGLPGLVGYWNTVTLADSFSVGALTVECGYISQGSSSVPSGNGSTLTVTSSLSWTGGTLNSNSVAGVIALAPGATGYAEPSYTNPGINQTVALGSTIELLGTAVTGGNPEDPPAEPSSQFGSSLSLMSGDYNISNNAGFIVGSQSHLQLLPMPDDAPPPQPQPQPVGGNPPTYIADVTLSNLGTKKEGGSVTVEENGVATFKPRARPANSTAPAYYKADGGYLKNRGGTVVIEDRTVVQLGGDYQAGDGTKWSAGSGVEWTKSVWQVQAACSILTAKGTYISAGQLEILPAIVASTGNPSTTEKVATIGLLPGSTPNYALLVTGTAKVSMPNGANVNSPYLTLNVGGNFGWSGGEIVLALSAGGTLCDNITADGHIVIANTPKLSLRWAETDMLNAPLNTVWELMKGTSNTGEITGAVNANWYADPNTKVVMDVSISGDKKKLRAIKQENKP